MSDHLDEVLQARRADRLGRLDGNGPEITGADADRIRRVVTWSVAAFWDVETATIGRQILRALPANLKTGAPPFVELCWRQPEGSLFVNCDRRAGHSGTHTWEKPNEVPF